jgi:probable HAF family extracellular repeat protein
MRVWNLLAAACSSVVMWAAPSYQVIGLGNLGGPATAYAINNNGVVTGTSGTPFGDYKGFVWSGGSLIALAGLPLSLQHYAVGINNSGTIVGSAAGANGYVPTQWKDGAISTIGSGEGNGMAINDSGSVAGTLNGQAFRTVNGQVQSLGTLMGGNWASAYGINASGEVAGYGNTATGAMRAFVSANGQLQQIGTFGGSSSYAMALNNAGQVTGNATNAAGYSWAFLYQSGLLTPLGTLGGSASYGYGINQSGSTVGYSWISGDTATAAFVYRDGTMRNLNDLIELGSGWDLQAAYGINDLGQIVGTGTFNGQQMAVLLNPLSPPAVVNSFAPSSLVTTPTPEPGTIGLLAVGIALIAFGGLRRDRGV